ncbi:phytanoyl-CoA dioxygenase family protein [Arenicella xantha]|uniref:Ectoine hydroxylase-related dioxygenase (Phytanoyl-CoA dioxygenase family) n=1 Tax=Arenicella xantha TaxID=644221 RepID=A0A395JIC9_9GAMM|nr:phytanoyl-CoA dioxygenase family protein [Arenicella xantha]RBP48356.1 ectoine hydroxylase-related dioxygenase (phytanoyl-CoA dioxygenase family) [Arenicella xantha]
MTLTDQQRREWDEQGFLLLKGFYSDSRIDQINSLIDSLWRGRRKLGAEYVIDIFVETANEKRVYFADAPKSARFAPYKLNDLFLSQPEIRKLIVGDELAPLLKGLLAGTPMVCNTLNFEFGSQQDYHFDTFYMPSPTPNKMVASWIALEDSTQYNGPLSYYPGSHKIPPYQFSSGSTIVVEDELPAFREYIYDEIEKRGLQAETLLAERGDVLIWHSQLFHGGSEITDKSKTRKSLVTHYFTNEDFPDQSPPKVGEHGGYMQRPAQPVGYPFEPKNWIQRTFG